MAGCDKKSRTQQISCNKRSGYGIWTNHAGAGLGAGRAREGAGDRKAREKIAMRFVCSVDFDSRSISMFFIFMHVPNV